MDINYKQYYANKTDWIFVLISYFIIQLIVLSLFYIHPYLFCILQVFCNFKAFIIYHDLGHNNFTPYQKINKILLFIFSIITSTPLQWGRNHKLHHFISNKLNAKNYDWNDTIYYTKQQFNKLSKTKKILYKIFRNPIIFFLGAPFLNWFILYRLPITINHYKYKTKIINTIGILCLFYILNLCFEFNIIKYYLFSIYLGGVLGIVLFHLQHCFNPSYVESDNWSFKNAALKGSSYINIPFPLNYFTMGIEFHHIHHLNIKIPGYNLKKCHLNHFTFIKPLSLKQIYNSLTYTLYDEDKKKFI